VVHRPVGEPDHRSGGPPAVVELPRERENFLERRSCPHGVPLLTSDQRHLVEDVHRPFALAALLEQSEPFLRRRLRLLQLSGGGANAGQPIERVPDPPRIAEGTEDRQRLLVHLLALRVVSDEGTAARRPEERLSAQSRRLLRRATEGGREPLIALRRIADDPEAAQRGSKLEAAERIAIERPGKSSAIVRQLRSQPIDDLRGASPGLTPSGQQPEEVVEEPLVKSGEAAGLVQPLAG